MQEASTASSTFEVPEPELTPREIVARAAAMRPELLERQAETEERTFYCAGHAPRVHARRASTGSCSRGASAATSSTSRPTSA